MSYNCQQCFQHLQIQSLIPPKVLKETYDQLARGDQLDADDRQNNILEQDAIFFGHSEGSTSNMSSESMVALRIKDFAEQKNIELKHPVCFDCFGEILNQLEYRVKSQEQERDMYKEELKKMEEELAEHEDVQDEDLRRELAFLEQQEKDLDAQISDVVKKEQTQESMLKNLTKSKSAIHDKENEIWQKVNDYERELSNQLE